MIEKLRELWNKIGVQFIKFGIVGVSNTLIALLTYYVVIFLGAHYLVANALGFIISTLNAYWWNGHFVFKKEGNQRGFGLKALFKSYVSYGASFVLSSFLLYLQVQVLGVSEMLAPIFNLMITTPLNFLVNKLWVYTQEKELK